MCKLNKSLYGLKQRQWFAKLTEALQSFGYSQSKVDYSLFTKLRGFIAILIYVDDLLIAGNNQQENENLKLPKNLKMKEGFQLSKSGILISQNQLDVIVGMTKARPLHSPMDTHVKLTPTTGDLLSNADTYQIGKLLYLTITRPDISFSVQVLAQFMQSPTTAHLQAAKRVVGYLLSSPGKGGTNGKPVSSSLNCIL